MLNTHEHLLSGRPDGWTVSSLNKIATRIESGGTPSRYVPAYWNGSIPWVTPGELTGHGDKYLRSTRDRITSQGCAASAARVVPVDSLIVTTRATIGSVALAGVPLSTNQGFKSIVFRGGCDPHFFYHLFKILKPEMVRRASGTTFLEISRREFGLINVPLPSLPEQRRIAEILDSVDEAIRSTERLVGKASTVSFALRRQLLLGNGLPDANRSSARIGDVLVRAEYGISSPLGYGAGVPVLRMNNLKGGEVDTADLKYTVFPVPRRLFLNYKDVLFNRTNSLDHVGRTSIWRGASGTTTFASYLVRLVQDERKILPEYLMLWLNLDEVQIEMRRFATPGVHQVNINPTNLKKVRIEFPHSLEQQEAICRQIAASDPPVTQARAELAKLEQLKQGLMEDLLTGRVRVPAERA
ncbi:MULTISPECIES: restriction endonuclease subunit S [unclassified Micromonospora]|uniref:restriction endonuclease subunit S n=1 Tax=unclassified Micromonospora TaxID=2617518 RepID=UPI002FF1E6EA